MPGIRWAHERELATTLGEEEGGGRLAGAYGMEASLQLDESLFHKSDHGSVLGGNNLLGANNSRFTSRDLDDCFDFGDDPQEAETFSYPKDDDKKEKGVDKALSNPSKDKFDLNSSDSRGKLDGPSDEAVAEKVTDIKTKKVATV